jgi:dUTPase
MEKKQKRFYKVGEVVWVVTEKQEGTVKAIDKENKLVTVVVKKSDKMYSEITLPLWDIDKLKYKAKEELVAKKRNNKLPTVYFAKVRENAIIPSKRDEDAGYDLYANVEASTVMDEKGVRTIYEIYCPVHKTTLVPTGIAMALPKTHYFNCKHERGSTGKVSMSVLAGVVDSGYRGEVFVAITPLHKDVLITSEVTETEVGENVILYPYSKAIAQGTIDLVPQVNIEVIDFKELSKIESERGVGALGASGK